MPTVPKLWPGARVAILAGGPSLTQSDVDACAAAGLRTLAIKDAIRMAPWADCLYACDAKWWHHYGPRLTYAGPRYGLEAPKPGQPVVDPWPIVLRNAGFVGLETDPSGLRTGKNSGFQAINLAVHLGARAIVLLGYDMRTVKDRHHWFGDHPYRTVDPPYKAFLPLFETLVDPLATLGVTVVNCTPDSDLRCFPQAPLYEALQRAA